MALIDRDSSPEEWARLKSVWDAQRRPELLVMGSTHYRVFTPDGDEAPKFLRQGEEMMYGSTSTGMAQVPSEPAPKTESKPTRRGKAKGG